MADRSDASQASQTGSLVEGSALDGSAVDGSSATDFFDRGLQGVDDAIDLGGG